MTNEPLTDTDARLREEDCYCVCHNSLSSCPSCEHCHGQYFQELQLRERIDNFLPLVDTGYGQDGGLNREEAIDRIIQAIDQHQQNELINTRADLAWCLGKLRGLGHPNDPMEKRFDKYKR